MKFWNVSLSLRNLILLALAVSFGVAASGCVRRRVVVVHEVEPAPVGVPAPAPQEAPPPPRVETPPPAPSEGYVWVEGYWVWRHGWRWHPGVWTLRPQPRAIWVPGHWVRAPRAWVWVPGRWR